MQVSKVNTHLIFFHFLQDRQSQFDGICATVTQFYDIWEFLQFLHAIKKDNDLSTSNRTDAQSQEIRSARSKISFFAHGPFRAFLVESQYNRQRPYQVKLHEGATKTYGYCTCQDLRGSAESLSMGRS